LGERTIELDVIMNLRFLRKVAWLSMELAKVTTSGQITIPIQIRRKLGIKEGDKVMFLDEGGKVVLLNSSQIAMEKLQSAMAGEAEKSGIVNEEDVVDLCKNVRSELYSKRYARNG
jgi:AbrB family looped-hinge helix DNA binding protein